MSRVALVTGAARGIGAASARALAARGWDVALVGLEYRALAATAAACGPRASRHEADVADADAVQAAVDAALGRHGRLDAVFANAGIALVAPLRRMAPADFARQLEVSVGGTFNTIHAVAEPLLAARGYLLVNASTSALAGMPGLGAYSAAKAATEALCDVLRAEWRPLGTGVGVLYCHWVDTDLVRGGEARAGGPLSRVRAVLPPPLNRTVGADTVARAVVEAIAARRARVFVPRWFAAGMPLRHAVRLATGRLGALRAESVDRAWLEAAAAEGAHAASRPRGPARSGT
jgi:NAD(P)-dependent dehydrogenase (short-subunit alcohol dehydrogenase family)